MPKNESHWKELDEKILGSTDIMAFTQKQADVALE